MVLPILRGLFIILAAAVTILYVLPFQEEKGVDFGHVVLMILLTIAVAVAIIAADAFSPDKKLSAISGVFLGLIAGLLSAYALGFVVDLVGLVTAPRVEAVRPEITPGELIIMDDQDPIKQRVMEYDKQVAARDSYLRLLEGVKVIIGLITSYICISLVLQTKDDFRFVIPYVEFAKQIRGPRPTVVDTSIIIDGRILDILETSIMQGTLVVPKFVLDELHQVADSADKLRRARGRRGLDILKQLQNTPNVDVVIDDAQAEGDNVDQKLVALCAERRGRLMTNDFNLTKIAKLRNVDVINLNDLTQALRPVVLPGEEMTIKLLKSGESAGQGVGYLEDGTMVVVENGRSAIGHQVPITVTSTYQTAAGRMIFGKYDPNEHPVSKETRIAEGEPPAQQVGASGDAEHSSSPATPPGRSDDDENSGPTERTSRGARTGRGRNPRRGG